MPSLQEAMRVKDVEDTLLNRPDKVQTKIPIWPNFITEDHHAADRSGLSLLTHVRVRVKGVWRLSKVIETSWFPKGGVFGITKHNDLFRRFAKSIELARLFQRWESFERDDNQLDEKNSLILQYEIAFSKEVVAQAKYKKAKVEEKIARLTKRKKK